MKAWTREELILAVNLYCKTPFGRIHYRNPEIIHLAKLLNRTPGSVSYKLANFASIDPSLDRVGAANVSKLDRLVWSEFFADWGAMAFKSEKMLEELNAENSAAIELEFPEGTTKEATVQVRVNQNFFRKMILASYNFRCCVTGLPLKQLLVASHIIPWSTDEKNRLNPQNGLCLNMLHDKAFDRGLITIDESYRMMVSKDLDQYDAADVTLIRGIEGHKISLPSRFLPNQEFLDYHRNHIFVR